MASGCEVPPRCGALDSVAAGGSSRRGRSGRRTDRASASGEASLRRSQPHQVRRVCLNQAGEPAAVPPLRRAFHHGGDTAARRRARPRRGRASSDNRAMHPSPDARPALPRRPPPLLPPASATSAWASTCSAIRSTDRATSPPCAGSTSPRSAWSPLTARTPRMRGFPCRPNATPRAARCWRCARPWRSRTASSSTLRQGHSARCGPRRFGGLVRRGAGRRECPARCAAVARSAVSVRDGGRVRYPPAATRRQRRPDAAWAASPSPRLAAVVAARAGRGCTALVVHPHTRCWKRGSSRAVLAAPYPLATISSQHERAPRPVPAGPGARRSSH